MKATIRRSIREGALAGLILYATVAVFFVAANLVTGEPAFRTAALLGGALFGGLRDPARLTLDPAWIVGYNGVHLMASLVLGFAASLIVTLIDRHRLAWYGFFFLAVGGFVMSLLLLGVLAVELAGVLRWEWLVAAHMLGAVASWAYLAWAHREQLLAAGGPGPAEAS